MPVPTVHLDQIAQRYTVVHSVIRQEAFSNSRVKQKIKKISGSVVKLCQYIELYGKLTP